MEHVVLDTDGTVNVDASCEAYQTALEAWKQLNEVEMVAVRKAVNEVLGDSKVPFAPLVSMVLVHLAPERDEVPATQKRVEAFVKNNTKEDGSGLYCTKNGKNGGYYRNTGEV